MEWTKPENTISESSVPLRPDRWRQKLWLLLFVPVCLCTISFFGTLLLPDLMGSGIATLTRYPSSQWIYSGSNEYGSSDWATAAQVFWTADSLNEVQQHYELFFNIESSQRNRNSSLYAVQDYPFLSLFWVPFDYRTRYTLSLTAVDLSTADQLDYSICCYFYGLDEEVNYLPQEGTIIILSHPVFRP